MAECCECFNVVKNNYRCFDTLDKEYVGTAYDLNCYIKGSHICTICDRAV